MKKFLLFFLLFGWFTSGYCQNITQHQADTLYKSLKQNLNDTVRIHNLLMLAEFNLWKQVGKNAGLDSGSYLIDQAKRLNLKENSPSIEGSIALEESYLVRKKFNDSLGKKLNDKAIDLLLKSNNYYDLGQAYYQRATYYDSFNDREAIIAFQLFEKGITAFKKANAVERQAYGYKRLGEFSNDVSGSLKYLNLSLTLYKSIRYQALQEVYDLISIAYIFDLNLQKALPYALLALKTAELNQDTTMQLCTIENHIGIIYFKKREFENAALYFVKALKTAEAYRDRNTIYLLADNIVNCDVNINKASAAKVILKRIERLYPVSGKELVLDRIINSSFVKVYAALKDINAGRPYAARLKEIDKTEYIKQNNVKAIDDNMVLAKFYLAAGETNNASVFIKNNDELIKVAGSTYDRLNLSSLHFRLDTMLKNYGAAVQHLLMTNKIQDSISNEAKAIEFQKQQVQFEAEKKDQQIKLFQQKEVINQSKLEHANLMKNLTFGGIVVMAVISFLIYRIYMQKQAANKIITHKNELLQQLLNGKEWLLKEVHHRVKNNLHTVICLLESQARYLENDALKAIESSQHRIYAMSLIHQKLYQSDDVKTIDMSGYIPELVKSLEESFDSSSHIRMIYDIEKIELEISQAIPLGLIINETITNSIKYAFPDDRKGEIRIIMINTGDYIQLEVADNGIGMPMTEKGTTPESLGIKLIKGLSEDLRGEYAIDVNNGTRITVTFKPENLEVTKRLSDTKTVTEVYV